MKRDTNTFRSPTEKECRVAAGMIAAESIVRTMSRDPHDAALAAYVEGGPSVEELEARILDFHAIAEARIAEMEKCGQSVGKPWIQRNSEPPTS